MWAEREEGRGVGRVVSTGVLGGPRDLGTPLGLAQRKRASPRGEAGTSGFLSVSADTRLGEVSSALQ